MLTTPFGEFPNRFMTLHFSTALIFPEFFRIFNRFVHKNLLKVAFGENLRNVINPLCLFLEGKCKSRLFLLAQGKSSLFSCESPVRFSKYFPM